MSKPHFTHYDLQMVAPDDFGSELIDLIMELNFLRRKTLGGSTHKFVFFQLKHIFQTLECLGSARIEGNQTTLAEYIEMTLDKPEKPPHSFLEIQNIEEAITFVESSIDDCSINRALISEIHRKLMKGLPTSEEGDSTPGRYRTKDVAISKSQHLPPNWMKVEEYMDELFRFINQENKEKYDLLTTALAHHRFAWIHPFGNGNGRTVRILTYAMLAKQGFNVHVQRVVHPTAIFCSNRESYYHHLALADTGSKEGLLNWAIYVLKGLKDEIDKIDRLSDYHYLSTEILFPMLKEALSLKYISEIEFKILNKVVEKQVIQANDLKEFFPDKSDSEVSRQIKLLTDKKILTPEQQGKRKYLLCFYNNLLLRLVYKVLDKKGFLPIR